MNKIIDGVVVAMTDAEVTAKNAEQAEAEAEEAANGYKRNRANEYPTMGDQLDMIYHNGDGGATFQAAIKAVKDKYPKP
jgi:L-ascorbate metabolism protein UlaG (beta-lactamase superfamily)